MEFNLSEDDKVLIVASDGIWEYMENEQVMRIVSQFYFERKSQEAAEKLVSEAFLTWKRQSFSRDDITCIVVFFHWFHKLLILPL